MDWKTYYCLGGITTQRDLQVFSIRILITFFSFFCRNGKADSQIIMELQRVPNIQNNLEKEHS